MAKDCRVAVGTGVEVGTGVDVGMDVGITVAVEVGAGAGVGVSDCVNAQPNITKLAAKVEIAMVRCFAFIFPPAL